MNLIKVARPKISFLTVLKAALAILIIISSSIFSQPLAEGYSKFLGCCVSNSVPATFGNYWNQVSPENGGKWGSVEQVMDTYNWGAADVAYNYAKQKGLPFKWHCLVWGQQQPPWITSLSKEEQAKQVEEWIRLVGERYPDIDFVDVVNEPLSGHAPAQYRDALGGSGSTGWDWVVWVFEKARKYLPKAKLHLNEYNLLSSYSNAATAVQIANILKARGLIDGICEQAHRSQLENATSETIKSNLDLLASTGLPVYISEFDVAPKNAVDDATQLAEMQRVFPILWNHPSVKGITFWGYIEGTMWQTAAYLLKTSGVERPALKWLRSFLSQGYYRTHKSGDWNDINIWEKCIGDNWVYPAPSLPKATDNLIAISDGNTVTLTAPDSIDQLSITQNGKLIINPGVKLYIKDAPGTADMTVTGTVENSGEIQAQDSAVIKFVGTGKYVHKIDGGSIPKAQWLSESTCQLEGLKTTAPTNGNQNFYNVVWNCPLQASDLTLNWNGNTVSGSINVMNTGSKVWRMCSPIDSKQPVINILGDFIQSGGEFSPNYPNNAGSITVNHSGNINITGGTFNLSTDVISGYSTTAKWNLDKGNVTLANMTIQNPAKDKSAFIFTGSNVIHTLSLNNVTYGKGGFPAEVDSGSTLNLGTSILQGEGELIIKPGASLQTAHLMGLDAALANTGTRSLSRQAAYIFSGSSAQSTGQALPDTAASLVINNSSGVSLSHNLFVSQVFELKSGTLSGTYRVFYGKDATLRYSSPSNQTTTEMDFPETAGPKNLEILARNVILHASRSIPGKLKLSGKLRLGDNTLTVGSASSTSTGKYVITEGTGSLRIPITDMNEALFPVGTLNYYAPAWIKNLLILDTGKPDTISVRVEADDAPAAKGGRVTAKWFLAGSIPPGTGDYTLKFGWVAALEDQAFSSDRQSNAKIFYLSDSTEAGKGDYTTQFDSLPYTVMRRWVDKLGTFGVGRFGNLTGVNDRDKNIPSSFSLDQNYPNPFNPSTVIKYALPHPARVRIVIYNLLGAEVMTLVDSYQNAGEYKIVWDATDNHDVKVPSGIYIYRLQSDDLRLQKKMILLR